MKPKLCVAFLWHMHQPYYKDPLTGEISMPWVRLHGVKDYLDMVQLLDEFPNIRQNFNLAPSLIEQIKDYENPQKIKDRYMDLSLKEAAKLTDQDKVNILSTFFMANWDTMVEKFPRFKELLAKRGKILPAQISQIANNFNTQDFLDLQVLFNLSWIDPSFQSKIPEIKDLVKKKSHYCEEDKKILFDIQMDILKKIIPKYKQMQESGRIEVSTSPYYHPILPLLCDSGIASEALPDIKLPEKFRHPEDANWQVKEAVKYYKNIFKKDLEGMWPSEGSVSEQTIAMLIENGIKWFASDEEVLYQCLQKGKSAEILYKPYILKRANGQISCVFRDHVLSDLIGFNYCRQKPMEAVDDFLKHLHDIYDYLPETDSRYLVPIILDGENAWEYYPNDGRDFLIDLYRALSIDPVIETVTIGQFLKEYPPKEEIADLFPGSWINANFSVWIGSEEKNLAWNYLGKTRDALVQYEKAHPQQKEKIRQAWQEIYIAEGSDWNWWYGDDHFSSNDDEFDRLYRMHLSNVYCLIGQDVPEYLKLPIRIGKVRPLSEPVSFFTPEIDGRDTNYYEWLSAGFVDMTKAGGTMHKFAGILHHFYYGFDKQKLYIRIDPQLPEQQKDRNGLLLNVIINQRFKIAIPLSQKTPQAQAEVFEKDQHSNWTRQKNIEDVALDKILEAGLDLKDIDAKPEDELQIQLVVQKDDFVVETAPSRGLLNIKVPPTDYEAQSWSV